ncbi:MAG: DNA adenine methylase [Pseudanabaenaceae cyanobacterium]
MLKSPLRFPGGKSRALSQILPLVPNFQEYREPMLGGGSLFIALKQKFPNCKFWVNDVNYELFCFWKTLQQSGEDLANAVAQIYYKTQDGRELFYSLLDSYGQGDEFTRAVRFFVLNRITFSGTVDSGGYSEQAFRGRFTLSSIDRLRKIAPLLEGVEITCGDYEPLIVTPGKEVFIFLDPPYYSATASRLYGKQGKLHLEFDHHRLARVLTAINHRWLLTYDDTTFIRSLYKWCNISAWSLQYGMNNYKRSIAPPGQEIFIANYPIQCVRQLQLNLE